MKADKFHHFDLFGCEMGYSIWLRMSQIASVHVHPPFYYDNGSQIGELRLEISFLQGGRHWLYGVQAERFMAAFHEFRASELEAA